MTNDDEALAEMEEDFHVTSGHVSTSPILHKLSIVRQSFEAGEISAEDYEKACRDLGFAG